VIASAGFSQHRYVFDQINGLQLDLIYHLTQSQVIHTPRDVENYLARLGLVAARVDEGIAEARAASREQGHRPSDSAILRAALRMAKPGGRDTGDVS
jgi:uncharacterized protein (DUF885 family)